MHAGQLVTLAAAQGLAVHRHGLVVALAAGGCAWTSQRAARRLEGLDVHSLRARCPGWPRTGSAPVENPVAFRRRRGAGDVTTHGVRARRKPRAATNSPLWSRSHCAAAYKLRATQSMAQVVSVNTVLSGWLRLFCRGSGTSARNLIKGRAAAAWIEAMRLLLPERTTY